MRPTFIALFVALFCLSAAHKTKEPCGCGKPTKPIVPHVPYVSHKKPSGMCRYKFCNGKSTFKIGKYTDKSFTRSICDLHGKKIGTVDQSGEAKLIKGSKLIPISKWSPYGLKQKFDPTFFKTFAIYKGKHAGVGHQTMQQNQKHFLKSKKCWILPFKAFQVLDKHGNAKEKHTNDPKDCIKFCTKMH